VPLSLSFPLDVKVPPGRDFSLFLLARYSSSSLFLRQGIQPFLLVIAPEKTLLPLFSVGEQDPFSFSLPSCPLFDKVGSFTNGPLAGQKLLRRPAFPFFQIGDKPRRPHFPPSLLTPYSVTGSFLKDLPPPPLFLPKTQSIAL